MFGFEVFVDADYASEATGRRSVSGAAVLRGKSPAALFSGTQITREIVHDRNRGCVNGGNRVTDALFVKGVLTCLVPDIQLPIIDVFEDNLGAKPLVECRLSPSNISTCGTTFCGS